MNSILKGNFKTSKDVAVPTPVEEDAESRFEREATSRLGGSIAFVSKKKVVWDVAKDDDAGKDGK